MRFASTGGGHPRRSSLLDEINRLLEVKMRAGEARRVRGGLGIHNSSRTRLETAGAAGRGFVSTGHLDAGRLPVRDGP